MSLSMTLTFNEDSSLPSTVAFSSASNSYQSNQSRGVNWCFTLNNYTASNTAHLLTLEQDPLCAYLVFGYETSSSGTPHLQGFIALTECRRLNQLKLLLGSETVHLELTRKVPNAIRYCKKDGNFIEFGTPPILGGRRTDLDNFKQSVKNGCHDLSILRDTHFEVFAKYPRFCLEYVTDNIPIGIVDSFPLRPWQQVLYNDLKFIPDKRKIIFIVDYEGNSGKTWFARYYAQFNKHVQIILPGKKADMTYTLKQDNRVLFIDAPRSKQGEFLQYDFLEEIKNGLIFSGKYESRMKYLSETHVVVMMNEQPDQSKLSSDRYDIRVVSRHAE